MAALVIDWGYVNLTRVQMQSVVDAGAVEGVRRRDVSPDNPAASDLNRRVAVSQLASWTYDDDFDLSSDVLQFGAGPDVTLTGGQTNLNALQTLSVSASPVYKPTLQWNEEDNLAHGDLVSGTYGNPDPGCPSSNPGIECVEYTRKDFVPADASASPIPSATANAFLVRMRRSVKPEPFQDSDSPDTIPGISSAGPTLPLLFGLGSLIQPSDPPGIRRTGITVRATAIADARPARGVGLPDPFLDPPRLGVTRFALDRAAWEDLSVDAEFSANVSGSGAITVGGEEVGRFLPQVLEVQSIGQPVPDPSLSEGASVPIDGYTPLYQDIEGTLPGIERIVKRIVGFARITMTGTIPGSVEIIKQSSQVATENATSSILPTFPIDLQPEELTALFEANRALQPDEDENEAALLTPVLVR